jgi:hypothetical protein
MPNQKVAILQKHLDKIHDKFDALFRHAATASVARAWHSWKGYCIHAKYQHQIEDMRQQIRILTSFVTTGAIVASP